MNVLQSYCNTKGTDVYVSVQFLSITHCIIQEIATHQMTVVLLEQQLLG